MKSEGKKASQLRNWSTIQYSYLQLCQYLDFSSLALFIMILLELLLSIHTFFFSFRKTKIPYIGKYYGENLIKIDIWKLD